MPIELEAPKIPVVQPSPKDKVIWQQAQIIAALQRDVVKLQTEINDIKTFVGM